MLFLLILQFSDYMQGVQRPFFANGASTGIRSRIKAALTKFIMGLVFLVLTLFSRTYMKTASLYEDSVLTGGPGTCLLRVSSVFVVAGATYACSTTAVLSLLIFRLTRIWIFAEFMRFKYYFAWCFSEGGAILAGFGCVYYDFEKKHVIMANFYTLDAGTEQKKMIGGECRVLTCLDSRQLQASRLARRPGTSTLLRGSSAIRHRDSRLVYASTRHI
jgi:hypothetical protein